MKKLIALFAIAGTLSFGAAYAQLDNSSGDKVAAVNEYQFRTATVGRLIELERVSKGLQKQVTIFHSRCTAADKRIESLEAKVTILIRMKAAEHSK